MTNRVFYEDPYVAVWNSEIIGIEEKDNKYLITLNETPFYPEGGGQPCDLGTIDGIKVSSVYEEGNTVFHVLDEKPYNKKVKCVVDFERRFDHMQQHTGEHIISGLFLKNYSGANKGFHMGEDYVTIDIDLSEISEDMIRHIEEEGNDVIYRNMEITTCVVTKDEAGRMPLRKELKVEEDIRVVMAGDIDCVACCGTHVAKTGEVGIIKIIRSERYKGMTRIYFKCGKRALRDYGKKFDIVTNLSRLLSTEEDTLTGKIEAQVANTKSLGKRINDLSTRLAEFEAKELIASSTNGIIEKSYTDRTMEELQFIAKYFEDKPYIIILSSQAKNSLMMGHDGSFSLHCGKLFKENIASFNGRGGGGPKRAQGSFEFQEDLKAFQNLLHSEAEKNLN